MSAEKIRSLEFQKRYVLIPPQIDNKSEAILLKEEPDGILRKCFNFDEFAIWEQNGYVRFILLLNIFCAK